MKKLEKENIDELQKMSDEYLRRKKSKTRIRIFAGLAALSSSVILLTGCEEPIENETGYDYVTQEAFLVNDSVANYEEALEKEVAAYLSEKTGLNIKTIDMRDIELVRDNGKCYMVVSGIMIDDVLRGAEECSITFEITEERANLMEKVMERTTQIGGIRYHYYIGKEDTIAHRYKEGFLSGFKKMIDDNDTKLVSLYNKDTNDILVFDQQQKTSSR